jgi:hypothetical protein
MDDVPDFLRRDRRALRQAAHFGRDDGEAAARVARPRGFDAGVERQEICLERNVLYRGDQRADGLRRALDLADRAGRETRRMRGALGARGKAGCGLGGAVDMRGDRLERAGETPHLVMRGFHSVERGAMRCRHRVEACADRRRAAFDPAGFVTSLAHRRIQRCESVVQASCQGLERGRQSRRFQCLAEIAVGHCVEDRAQQSVHAQREVRAHPRHVAAMSVFKLGHPAGRRRLAPRGHRLHEPRQFAGERRVSARAHAADEPAARSGHETADVDLDRLDVAGHVAPFAGRSRVGIVAIGEVLPQSPKPQIACPYAGRIARAGIALGRARRRVPVPEL